MLLVVLFGAEGLGLSAMGERVAALLVGMILAEDIKLPFLCYLIISYLGYKINFNNC